MKPEEPSPAPAEALEPYSAPPEPVYFDAVLYPRRQALAWVVYGGIPAAGLLGFAFGMLFLAQGVWPAVGFVCAMALVAVWARGALDRNVETLRLTGDRLVIQRLSANGRVREWELRPHWLQVRLDDPGGQLRLFSHGRQLVIGAELSRPERRAVAEALDRALDRIRQGDPPEPQATTSEK